MMMIKKIHVAVVSVLALNACASFPPSTPPDSIKVMVPVPVKCLGELPQKPALITDQQLVQMSAPEFVSAVHLDRLQRDIYEAGLEAAIAGCE